MFSTMTPARVTAPLARRTSSLGAESRPDMSAENLRALIVAPGRLSGRASEPEARPETAPLSAILPVMAAVSPAPRNDPDSSVKRPSRTTPVIWAAGEAPASWASASIEEDTFRPVASAVILTGALKDVRLTIHWPRAAPESGARSDSRLKLAAPAYSNAPVRIAYVPRPVT